MWSTSNLKLKNRLKTNEELAVLTSMTLEGLEPGRGGAEGRTLSVSMSCLLAVLFSDQVEPALCSRPLEDVGYTEAQADPGTSVARYKYNQ